MKHTTKKSKEHSFLFDVLRFKLYVSHCTPRVFSYLAAFFFGVSPAVAFAATAPTDFKALVTFIIDSILTPIIALIFALAFVAFLWGGVQFIQKADDQKAREAGRNKMLYGIIALAVMLSVWGLVNILLTTFGLNLGFPALPTGWDGPNVD
ncbi:MAG: hypothetical protein A3J08_02475 [Candidatus Lloydbacteria bacterium RIFCSPLOWO2_02_FULL_51_11]|uniref:Uncharacterized protein n=1 Tax=Candidatus Lloydbacteria bacterium RIFCSPLOWO2_02_FULL_51_11 TaxID=1798667 RepID=A0A1G2DS84_9BACT|nr:MAG: hypothetical protein A3J08_02475 [Candidatus Lloydbacteria bacterium RIFCSPLOWO2_02_FULL_51_11]